MTQNTQEQVFNPDPSEALPLRTKTAEGMMPTLAGRIYKLNQELAGMTGREAHPYIADTESMAAAMEGHKPWPYPGKITWMGSERPNTEADPLYHVLAMAPGAVSVLLRRLQQGGAIPMYAVKIPSFDERSALFAVAGTLQKADGMAASSLDDVTRANIPSHLQPRPTSDGKGGYSLQPDLVQFQNTRLTLGDAYQRARSLLGDPPPTPRGGHSAVDGQHNPGIHRLVVAGTLGTIVSNPGALLHELHGLGDRMEAQGKGTLAALQSYFAELNGQRPAAPISVVRLDAESCRSAGILIPDLLLDPKTRVPLNISALAPMMSVIGEYAFAGDPNAQLKDSDQGLHALEKGAGVSDIDHLL